VKAFEIFRNDGLLNLKGLENLTSAGSIDLEYNYNLVSLEGLNNLTKADGIDVSGNFALTDIQALSNVNDLSGFSSMYNLSLTSLHGLEGVTKLNGLTILGNPLLPSLNGLQNLTSVKSITINDNPALTTLQHLSGVTQIIDDEAYSMPIYNLAIINNNALESLAGLENINTFKGEVLIKDNVALSNLCSIQPVMANGTFWSDVVISNNLYNPSAADIANGTNCSMD